MTKLIEWAECSVCDTVGYGRKLVGVMHLCNYCQSLADKHKGIVKDKPVKKKVVKSTVLWHWTTCGICKNVKYVLLTFKFPDSQKFVLGVCLNCLRDHRDSYGIYLDDLGL